MANWDDYRVFLEVARRGSLSGAAPALKMDPATVGRRIQRLETALKATLFVKLQRGYVLTEAGQKLQDQVEQMESTEKSLQGTIFEQANSLSGSIRIGAPDGIANFILPKICAEFCSLHPNLDLQILSLPRVFSLSKREADIALMVTPPTSGRLMVRKVSNYHLHLAAHRDYLAQHPVPTTKQALKSHRIIGYIPDLIFDSSLDYSAEITPNQGPNLSSNSVSVQMQLAQNKGGICLAHDFALPHFQGLQMLLQDQVSVQRSFYLVRHKDDVQNHKISAVSKFLTQGVKSEISRLESLVKSAPSG
ncbi:LysR family transcriptional regulator [Amylibacter marinus]|uniref:LysR family transcriptional regulator n=1 Tax=Amylibacter marinus TaxID=1475483 RepID=A0ABQ5VYC1_9RHOB|nr:LysR family transcriptional regulator [Amylibacter marinus]GLQ36139.1 LysR family transcriptional regulator [Amylibacter marinus]